MHRSRKCVPAFVLLAIVAVVVVSAGYFVLWGSEDWAGKFLFIESRTIVEAEVLQGKWSILIDFPFYRYDVSTGRIEYYGNPFDLGKLLAVYGSSLAYRGAGGGTSSCLYPIYSTPCAACDDTSSLDSIDKDGTVHIIYENKQIVLSLNQHWQTENESIEHFEGAVVRFKQTITIENLGYWKKANIRIHNSPTMFLMYSAMLSAHATPRRTYPTRHQPQQRRTSTLQPQYFAALFLEKSAHFQQALFVIRDFVWTTLKTSLKWVSIGIMVIVAFLSGFFTANVSQGLWVHTTTIRAPKVSVTFLYNRSCWKQPNEMAIVLRVHDSANKSYEGTFYLRSVSRSLALQLEQGKTYEYEVVFLKDQFNLPQSMKFYGNRADFAYVTWEEWVEILDRGKFVASDGLEVELNMLR